NKFRHRQGTSRGWVGRIIDSVFGTSTEAIKGSRDQNANALKETLQDVCRSAGVSGCQADEQPPFDRCRQVAETALQQLEGQQASVTKWRDELAESLVATSKPR